MKMKVISKGYLIIVILALLPVARWLVIIPLKYRFSNFYNSATSIGQLMSLPGMVLFSLNLILGSRWKFLEDLFGGMNRVYIAHHLIGGLTLILLIFHPLFLGLSFLTVSLNRAALFFLPGENWAINLGIGALLLLMALLILTFYVELPYEIWRFTHKFLGIAFFLGSLHALFIESDISRDTILRNYFMVIIAAGTGAYVFRSLLGKFFIPRHRYLLKKINPLPGQITELEMEPVKESMSYLPGQFIFVNFISAKVKNEKHPFSITSPPSERELKLTVKSLGDFTGNLKLLDTGDAAEIEGPYGRFSYLNFTNRNQIWVAGGIGITPFLSMARTLYRLDFSICLFYSAAEQSEAVFLEELLGIAAQNPNFVVYTIFTKTQGRLSAEIIQATVGDLANFEIFICGPPPMMISLKRQLKRLGVSKDRIHSEEFQLL
ncbi:hypothetical protein A3J20_05145 [Candidatus Gottesmanbacteria bacterium RIFCSPLOWO2_02_FULL_42_29]|uniref:FAD-binding FR-type domain-containing protein n=2 Tax=Candidatus Gottesmaniibacteriota TaxID=1752720 RepID=A0A1F6BHJ8_9BACT|nr:MAG: hypothetical protein UV09_C0016G0006 [Candidatus Gottesmanbacteria bacterium GW2011_GWA2_42_18]KKS76191.1 MAG: hypothetical protein UV46_C0007G0017 [Candidatus Gottesmanbacteria bacterium GW2011_GWC2_42_8]OGG11102.1 MAG: hypothetical protein A2781_00075 [Candidatus Gottesmanbacteria bacterium RIFCSPHIGHO2_01_FULL_42_27]OGG21190.1 MAG: hypothetical protein A3E72_03785 [Candidatus Gottesmanbacteria bacterium RIFCSPHIGHO2_12_FULL_43_26]OGG33935.1 MAG: hypothetical protein A3G68_00205 [Cand